MDIQSIAVLTSIHEDTKKGYCFRVLVSTYLKMRTFCNLDNLQLKESHRNIIGNVVAIHIDRLKAATFSL